MNKQQILDELELISLPGETIQETIESIGMSQAELAMRMGRTRPKINDIISGKEPITINTAMQLENVLGIDAQFWLNMESIYREKLAKLNRLLYLDNCKEWMSYQPLKSLVQYGLIQKEKDVASNVDLLLKFYGVSTPEQWSQIYASRLSSSYFRKSEKHTESLSAISAVLRIGELKIREQRKLI